MRSVGACSTGAATAIVRIDANAATAAASLTRAVIRHDRCDNEKGTCERPRANVAYAGRELGVAQTELEGGKDCHLRQAEHTKAGHERPPVEDDECRYRQRHV